MPISCEQNDLATSAACFMGMPPIQLKAVQIALLCAAINGTTLSCDKDSLAEAAKCYMGMPPIQQDAVIIVLLCQLLASISSGGTFAGTGSPEGVLTANPGSTYLQLDGGNFWVKESGTGNTGWVELISG